MRTLLIVTCSDSLDFCKEFAGITSENKIMDGPQTYMYGSVEKMGVICSESFYDANGPELNRACVETMMGDDECYIFVDNPLDKTPYEMLGIEYEYKVVYVS